MNEPISVGGERSEPALPPFYSEPRTATHYSAGDEARTLFKPHDDRMAVIVGSGPSLQSFDFSQLRRPYLYTFAINHEAWRNRDKYIANAWIFFDTGIMEYHRGGARKCPMCGGSDDLPEGMTVFSRREICNEAVVRAANKNKPVPEWLYRIKAFDVEVPWQPENGRGGVYMRRTTATAAMCLAYYMGFKHIALLGVDCYTQDSTYYYSGEKPKKLHARGKTQLGPNIYSEDRHMRMIADFTQVSTTLARIGWEGSVYQCSTLSPMSCFTKVSWSEAIRRYGR